MKLPSARFIKITAALLAIPVLVAAGFLIRYYYIFDEVIESKLTGRAATVDTQIFAAPMVLFPGSRMSRDDLAAHLQRLGYTSTSLPPGRNQAYFTLVNGNEIQIHNDGVGREDENRSVTVTFAGPAIRTLTEAATHKTLPTFALKPELISNFITKSREKRRRVTYQDLPSTLIDAVLASEDRRFFSHSGVDPIRILKALIVDIRERDTIQGASTLTQQFVKNYFLTPDRTWRRKMADAYMAVLLEQRLSKQEIFALYSNEVYLGQRGTFSIVGFGEAAEAYFDKSVRDLDLGEAATLAGIISAPNRYTPLRYPDRAKVRRDLVLDQMAEFGFITQQKRDQVKASPLAVKPSTMLNYSDAPYFVDFVQDILAEKFGDTATHSDYKIYTSLDMALQQAAYEALRNGITEVDTQLAKSKQAIPPGTVQSSLIAVDPRDGKVLAMIAGRNYGLSQFDRITQSKRQPGSIFKPFVYAAAIETAYDSPNPMTPVSILLDAPTEFQFDDLSYEPHNFKNEYFGKVTLRQAITKSLNIPTIKLAERIGYARITELAKRLGLNEQIKPYPAMAIGSFEVTPLEMVRAYTAFANQGKLVDLAPIQMITGKNRLPVFVSQTRARQVLTPEVAFMVTSLLESVINQGTGAGARARGFALPAAGKTGTSHDGWFAGYTPDLLCIVWVGFDDNRELILSGSQAALPIWTEFMKKAAAIRPLSKEPFVRPEGIVEAEIDPSTGLLANETCLEHQVEFFIKGTEPVIRCYGDSYERMLTGGTSIYSTLSKAPASGADNANGAEEPKKVPPKPIRP